MEVVLLGTGGPRGWPEAGCTCASCATAGAQRTSRAPSAALVDGVLLLDGGEGAARVASAAGRSLADVRWVLLSGTQPAAPGLLRALGPQVEVLGPPAVLEPFAAQAARARLVAVSAGQRVQAGRHVVQARAQGPGVAWEVAAPDGGRLLYAPGRAPVADVPDAACDLVLLGLGADAGQHLARLRAAGAAGARTEVCAVGHDHDEELPDGQQRRLRAWGMRLVPDGTCVPASDGQQGGGLSGRTLVLGGVRSGKSALAERLLGAQPRVTYVATGGTRDDDPEWRERVAAHVARRPPAWRTVETTEVARCLREAQEPVLVDCLGTWLTGRLDRHGVWDGAAIDPLHDELDELVAAWRAAAVPVVAVSNEVGSGVVPASASGRLFRDLLGVLNARVAAASETVLLTVAGIAVPLREQPTLPDP